MGDRVPEAFLAAESIRKTKAYKVRTDRVIGRLPIDMHRPDSYQPLRALDPGIQAGGEAGSAEDALVDGYRSPAREGDEGPRLDVQIRNARHRVHDRRHLPAVDRSAGHDVHCGVLLHPVRQVAFGFLPDVDLLFDDDRLCRAHDALHGHGLRVIPPETSTPRDDGTSRHATEETPEVDLHIRAASSQT